MNIEDAIVICEAEGLRLIRPRETKDEQLRGLWNDALRALRMARDIAEDGGRLTIEHKAWLSPCVDPVEVLQAGVLRMVNTILADAVVEREKRDASD